jgi:16S rRNA (uracil1498-N3)-methyltransferase
MSRFYIPPEQWQRDALALRDAEAHHCCNVLRLGPGDRVVVFNGLGVEISADIESVTGREVRLRPVDERTTRPPRCRITLAQSIPKGKNMEWIVQKAVELGASEIVPLITERTVVQLEQRARAHKQAKWQQIAIEAAKQCGQNWLPQVRSPRALAELFSVEAGVSPANRQVGRAHLPPSESVSADLKLIGSLEPEARSLKDVLADYRDQNAGVRPTNALVLIGPEGDFTPSEYRLAREHGCRAITFGWIVLRVETAALYCLSVLSHELL